jgi:peptidoglycan/LPS O-acetylase OafA/YrhL
MNSKLYFKNLDSIRFFAAFLVFISHTYAYPLLLHWHLNLIGRLGVLIFFVLSGFLITYLLLKEHEENGCISLKKFYIRRVLRIWPLYFFSILLTLIIYHTVLRQLHVSYGNFVQYITFLSNFDLISLMKHDIYMLVPMSLRVTWSVSVEEQFYLFWPLLFVFFPRKLWSIPIIIVLVLSTSFRFINRTDSLLLDYHTCGVLTALAIGGAYAFLIKRNIRFRSFFESTNTSTHLISFIITFFLFRNLSTGWLQEIFIEVAFGFIITAQAITKKQSILNLSNIKFARNFGKYTYAIYMLHPIALAVVNDLLLRLKLSDTAHFVMILDIVLGFGITILMAMLSYHFCETPFLKLKEKFTFSENKAYL